MSASRPNPYTPPAAPLRDAPAPPARSSLLLACAWAAALLLTVVAVLMPLVIDAVAAVFDTGLFKQVGFSLPARVRWLTRWPQLWTVFPAAAALLALDVSRRRVHHSLYRRGAVWCIGALLLLGLGSAGVAGGMLWQTLHQKPARAAPPGR